MFTSLRGYQRSWLRPDLIAGLTVWAVLIPEALAYATIAGVSPVVGLYAAPGALILYAAFGSSRHLVTGPMAATAALSAAAIGDLTTAGAKDFTSLTIALAIAVGIAGVLAGVFRLGFLANFISEPVLKGFIVGLALTIIIGQVPKLFGIPKTDGDFFEQLWGVIEHLDDTQALTLLVGAGSLALVLALRRFAPSVPGSLVAVALGIALVAVFDLDQHGVSIVGHIDAGLPSVGLPDAGAGDYLDLSQYAIGVLLIGFAEGLGAAKTYAERNHYEIDPNRELIGLGTANLGAGLSSGMVVNGSLSKTAVNGTAGAKTQASSLAVAVLTVLTLLFLTGLFEDLPDATLGAVVIAALIELVDIPTLVRLYRTTTKGLGRIYGVAARPDFIAALAAMLGVLIFDTLPGLFIGIAVSLLLLLYRASRPNVAVLGLVPGTRGQYGDIARHPENTQLPDIVILRPEAGLFFANADTVKTQILVHVTEATTAVVLDAETVPSIDVTTVSMLQTLAEQLDQRGTHLVLARDVGQVRDLLRATDSNLAGRIYPNVQEAIDALRHTD